MATIEVPRNTFFKKQTISTAVTIYPQYSDLSSSTDTTFELTTGVSPKVFILSGTVPDRPAYGNADLNGGFLRTFVSGVNFKNNRATPEIRGYVLRPHVTLAEGGFSLANRSGSSSDAVVGNKLAVYSSRPFNDVALIQEEFEGAKEDFNTITRVGGNSNITFSDPYIAWDNLSKVLEGEGMYSSWKDNKKRLRNYKTGLKNKKRTM